MLDAGSNAQPPALQFDGNMSDPDKDIVKY